MPPQPKSSQQNRTATIKYALFRLHKSTINLPQELVVHFRQKVWRAIHALNSLKIYLRITPNIGGSILGREPAQQNILSLGQTSFKERSFGVDGNHLKPLRESCFEGSIFDLRARNPNFEARYRCFGHSCSKVVQIFCVGTYGARESTLHGSRTWDSGELYFLGLSKRNFLL